MTPRHSILKRFGYLLSAHWAGEILRTAFMISLARYSTETFGQFMLAMSAGQLLLFTTEFGLNQHLTTILARKKNYPTRVLGQATLLKSFLFIVGWSVLLAFIFWQGYSSELRTIVIIIATSFGLGGLASSFFIVCQILGRQDVEGKTRSVASLIGYSYGLSALFAGLNPIVIAIFKPLEVIINLSTMLYLFFRRSWKKSLNGRSAFWKTWKEGVVYTGMAVCAIFYNKINMFFLQNYAGSRGVAQYNATWQIVDGISILVSSLLLGKVLFPVFTRLWATDKDQLIKLAQQTAAWLVAAALPISYILYVESDRIILTIFGVDYFDAIMMQKYLVGCIVLAFTHNLASYLMIGMHRQRLLLVFYILGLGINLVACIFLIPKMPLAGTAYAILITKGCMALFTVSFCQWAIGLFTKQTIMSVLAALAASATIHFLMPDSCPRELAEAAVLFPLLGHVYILYKKYKGRVRPVIN